MCGIPPTTPFVANIPSDATVRGDFVAVVVTNGDGRKSVTSDTPKVCKVDGDKVRVRFSHAGTCTLTAHVSAGTTYASADGAPQSFAVH